MSLVADGANGRILIVDVDPQGPSAHIPVGRTLAKIGDLAVEQGNLAEDPDTLRSYADFSRLLGRQGHFMALLGQGAVAIGLDPDAKQVQWVQPATSRPISSLPLTFWSQILAGGFGLLIEIWVWSLRIWDLNAGLVAMAGIFIVAMIFPAAIYSTREIALEPHLFRWFAAIDHLGALGYGVAMVALFYLYPRRLVPPQALWALPLIFGSWWILDTEWLVFARSASGLFP